MSVQFRQHSQSPIFYFYDGISSDREWILLRMAQIPTKHKAAVTREYERLYMTKTEGHRKTANTYLQAQAVAFRGQS